VTDRAARFDPIPLLRHRPPPARHFNMLASCFLYICAAMSHPISHPVQMCPYTPSQLENCFTAPKVFSGSSWDALMCSRGTPDTPNISFFAPLDFSDRVECQMGNTLGPRPGSTLHGTYVASPTDLCTLVWNQVTPDTGKTCTRCQCPPGRYGIGCDLIYPPVEPIPEFTLVPRPPKEDRITCNDTSFWDGTFYNVGVDSKYIECYLALIGEQTGFATLITSGIRRHRINVTYTKVNEKQHGYNGLRMTYSITSRFKPGYKQNHKNYIECSKEKPRPGKPISSHVRVSECSECCV
jgi:hypothetical protein